LKNNNKVELLELRLELSTKDKRISIHNLHLRLWDNHIQRLDTKLAKPQVINRPLPDPFGGKLGSLIVPFRLPLPLPFQSHLPHLPLIVCPHAPP
jgi:hypothetical protein